MNALGTAIRSLTRTSVAGVRLVIPAASTQGVSGWWILPGEDDLGCHVAPR